MASLSFLGLLGSCAVGSGDAGLADTDSTKDCGTGSFCGDSDAEWVCSSPDSVAGLTNASAVSDSCRLSER